MQVMAALPLSYASFVQSFARVTADGTAHDELAWKRQKVVAKAAGIAPAREDADGKARKPSNVDRVPMIRYAMGADDNLYLQSGIGMLFRSQGVDPAKELPLSPAALYTSSAINALRKSLLKQQIDHANNLAVTANANKADYVRTLNKVFYDQYEYMRSPIDSDAPDKKIVKALKRLKKQLEPGELLYRSETLKEHELLVADKEKYVHLHANKVREANILEAKVATLKAENDQLNVDLGIEKAQSEAAAIASREAKDALKSKSLELETAASELKMAQLKQASERKLLEEKQKTLENLQKETKVEPDEALRGAEEARRLFELAADELKKANAHLIEIQAMGVTTSTAARDRAQDGINTAQKTYDESFQALTKAESAVVKANAEAYAEVLKLTNDVSEQDSKVKAADRMRNALTQDLDQRRAEIRKLEHAAAEAKTLLEKEQEEKLKAKEDVATKEEELAEMTKKLVAAEAEVASSKPGMLGRLQRFLPTRDEPITTNASLVGYALARGLCGHRGPHEAPSDAPTDALLTYAVPSGIVHALARTKHLHVPESFAPPPPPPDAPDPFVQGEVDAALAGDFAIDAAQPDTSAVRPARAVRWQPRGPHAEALATAAALEHAAARCTQLADAGDLSERAQARLRDMATTFKLHQLDSLYEISCAIESGEELPLQPETPMVTRPVAQLRGALHYAHDAGHHPAPPTAVVDEGARWTASDQRAQSTFRSTTEGNVYLAPSTERLGYQPMPTGVPSTTPAKPPLKSLGSEGFSGSIIDAMNNLVLWGLYYYNRPSEDDINYLKRMQDQLAIGESDEASPVERRGGVWNEFLRDMSITSDRVWVFVRTVSGLIGEDASSLVSTADDASITAAREQKQREREISDRVATFQAKIVDSLVAGMVRESKLQLDVHQTPDAGEADAGKAASKLVVINANTAKQIRDLASGESGRPFFEANVALRNLTDRSTQNKQPLGDIVQAITEVASKLKKAMEADAAQVSPPGTTLAELSLPRNSYFVKLREDTAAAIRSAFDKLTHELSHSGVRQLRLYELVEGCDHLLSSRFAEFVGHVLIQNRSSTGVSALYASRSQLTVNASQAYVSLRRLVSHAAHYASHVPMPNFDADDAETLQAQRDAYFLRQKDVTCIAHQRDVARPSQLRIVNRLPGSFGAPGGGGVSRYGLYG